MMMLRGAARALAHAKPSNGFAQNGSTSLSLMRRAAIAQHEMGAGPIMTPRRGLTESNVVVGSTDIWSRKDYPGDTKPDFTMPVYFLADQARPDMCRPHSFTSFQQFRDWMKSVNKAYAQDPDSFAITFVAFEDDEYFYHLTELNFHEWRTKATTTFVGVDPWRPMFETLPIYRGGVSGWPSPHWDIPVENANKNPFQDALDAFHKDLAKKELSDAELLAKHDQLMQARYKMFEPYQSHHDDHHGDHHGENGH